MYVLPERRALMKSSQFAIVGLALVLRSAAVLVPSARVLQPCGEEKRGWLVKKGMITGPLVPAAPTWMCDAVTLTMSQTITRKTIAVPLSTRRTVDIQNTA